MALYRGSRFAEALQELKAYRRMTGRADQNHLIADCLRALGKPAGALPLTDEALAASDVSHEVKLEAAIVGASALADQGRYPEAMSYLRKARTRAGVADDQTLRLWYVKADILEKSGRRSEAADEFRKIARHDPSAFDVVERITQLD
jgi:tetratricopeptide (TPR) repeat protein